MTNEPTTSTAVSTITLGPPRKRTITWYDPAGTVELGRQLNGRDYLLVMKGGRLPDPPIVRLAGIEAIRIDHGDTLYRCRPDESFLNPSGLIHRGLICTLLDYAAASALLATLPAGTGFTTIELKVSYLRPVHAGDTLRAHGWITKPGKPSPSPRQTSETVRTGSSRPPPAVSSFSAAKRRAGP